MARRKKNTKPEVEKEPVIKEYEGYKLGDLVRTKVFSGKPRTGTIAKFYLDDKQGPAFSFIDEKEGRYTMSLVEWIQEVIPRENKKRK